MTNRFALALFFALIGIASGRNGLADPQVKELVLVKETRVDRTIFDYTFAVKLQGDGKHYSSGVLTVASADKTTIVIKSSLATGAIDADQRLTTPDFFIIRKDRTTQLNPSLFGYSFRGVESGGSPNILSIGTVAFVEDRGRPLHPGTFPLNADAPVALSPTTLEASIFGSVNSAKYSLLDLKSKVLGTGNLVKPLTVDVSSPAYFAQVVVPNVPFKIQISATSATSGVVNWTSAKTYTPSATKLSFTPTKTILAKGETTLSLVKAESSSVSGSYTLRFEFPPGFAVNCDNYKINIVSGVATTVPCRVTAPTSSMDYSFFDVAAILHPDALGGVTQRTTVEFVVE